MVPDRLTDVEKDFLLRLARESLTCGVNRFPLPRLDLENLSETLRQPGASFVTLTKHGQLRGCIGALEPYQPLAEDVREHAVAAALEDWRFPNVAPGELTAIHIEVSRLTAPARLEYEKPEDLLTLLRPGVDGVVLRDGSRRATFLPQVWEQIPNTPAFLGQLCQKMGAAPDLWKRKKLDVFVYQVEEFHEK
jgi:AmmeMemoRadiSam system protein A